MLTDMYMVLPGENNYDPNAIEQYSSQQVLLGQIKMLLYTTKGSVLGSPDFGFNLEDYLFSFNLSTADLQKRMVESIYQNCPDASTYNVKVDISFFKGSVRDICLVDIYIDDQKLLGIAVS